VGLPELGKYGEIVRPDNGCSRSGGIVIGCIRGHVVICMYFIRRSVNLVTPILNVCIFGGGQINVNKRVIASTGATP